MIPSKYYYDEDTQNQWKQQKQSKEQLKNNRKNKLDPEHQNEKLLSAKEVLDKKASESVSHVPAILQLKPVNDEGEEVDEGFIRSDDDVDIVYDDDGNEIEFEPQPKKKEPRKKALLEEEKKKKEENLMKLKSKLQQKIEAMKAKRKAPGSKAAGAPKSRDQILEERRKKKEARDALKRKRDQSDDEEESENEDELDKGEESEEEEEEKEKTGVLFQNIVFNDGDRTTSDLTKLRKGKKKKGPANRDIKAHLAKVQQKKQKLAKLDESEKKNVETKDKWNKMIQQAEGIKVKDDEKLLKKALKNKERLKRKSENQWYERTNNVNKSIQDRLKIREENLKIRKENKGVKRKLQKKQIRKFQGPKAKKGKKKKAGF